MATITIKKISCMPEETNASLWRTIIEAVLTVTGPLFFLIWKGSEYVNKRAEAANRKEKEFVKEVATEVAEAVVDRVMNSALLEIKQQLMEIKQEVKKVDDRVDDVYKQRS